MEMTLHVLKHGTQPTRGSEGAACVDCYARIIDHNDEPSSVLIERAPKKVPLGFRVSVPRGHAMIISGRSGLSMLGVGVATGTVDPDYTGEVCAVMHCISPDGFVVRHGMRIAQARIVPAPEIRFVPGEVGETERGDNGFGSTGL